MTENEMVEAMRLEIARLKARLAMVRFAATEEIDRIEKEGGMIGFAERILKLAQEPK